MTDFRATKALCTIKAFRTVTLLRTLASAALLLAIGFVVPAVALESFTLNSISIVSGNTTYTAKELSVTDSVLSRAETEALLRDDSTPVVQRWEKINAARVTAPAIVSETTAGTTSQIVTYRDLVLESINGGRVARARAGNATASVREPQTGGFAAQTGALSFEGIDLPAMAHIVAEGRTSPDEAPRTVVASGRVEGLDIDLPGGKRARVGNVAVRDLGGRALAVPMTSLVDLTPKPGDGPPSPERQNALMSLFADLLTSQSVGSVSISDIAVQPKEPGGMTVSAAGFLMEDIRNGRIGRMVLDGFSLADAQGGRGSAKQFLIAGLDLAPTLKAGLIADRRTPVPATFERIALSGLTASVGNVGQPVAFGVESSSIDATNWRELGPADLAIGINHLFFDLPTDEPKLRPLIDLGYKRIDLSFATASSYDSDKQQVALKTFSLTAPEIGTFDLSALMTNVAPAILGPDRDKAYSAMLASLFKRAVLTATDGGVLARLVETQARQAGSSPPDVRAQWASAARAAVLAFLADNSDREAVADAVERFVRSGGRFNVTADAQSGLGVLDAMLAGGVQGLLGRVRLTAGN